MEKQRTISKPVSLTGIGIHTGNNSTITFHPAPANYGYKFVRTDVPEKVEIPAILDFVTDISRGTTIGKDGVTVHTVEHVIAALAGLQIDNCRIELSSNEPPVFDGSSLPFVEKLLEAGIEELEAPRQYFVIEETVRYTNEEKGVDIVALPTDDFRITVMIDYYNPALGSQHTGLFNLEKEFVSEFAPARTFCFLTEVEMLRKQGLIKGGSFDNAVVIADKDMTDEELVKLKDLFSLDTVPVIKLNGLINDTELRYKNEPARHKLLDMLGDLALIGIPIKAQILAARPGHASNIEFARKIRNLYLKQKASGNYKYKDLNKVLMNIDEIMNYLPHRYPFLLVDRIVDFDVDNKIIIGYKNVTINEPFFTGHFPGKPIMPGVLILEALAQTGGLILLKFIDDLSTKLALYMTIKEAKFRKPVLPGDKLVMEVKLTGKRFNVFNFYGVASVDGQIAAEAEFQAALVDKEL